MGLFQENTNLDLAQIAMHLGNSGFPDQGTGSKFVDLDAGFGLGICKNILAVYPSRATFLRLRLKPTHLYWGLADSMDWYTYGRAGYSRATFYIHHNVVIYAFTNVSSNFSYILL